jgi:hypothetical protein
MPGHRRRWTEPVLYWGASAAIVAGLFALLAWRERPPRPRPATLAPTEFSAARAWPVLAYLADTIGYRVAGTPGADSAAAYLVRTLRRIPGVEVEVQEVSGALAPPGGRRVLAYTVRNVLVRIPGRSPLALLLSAHYDTPPGSVGAADDGVAVASLVELVRALAAGPPLAHTVIVNINDGEEQGLVGAHGFTQHPWVREVRAFVNLESAGPHGKAILFQAGPGNPWLTSAYARAVPYPYGTVVAQDIFQSGSIPSDTDFRIYRDFGGLRGLDIALYQEGWAYHTQRDRTWNVSPGTVQHMGANALALTRALANGPLPGNVSAERAVYYDVLGAFMLVYTARTARLLAALAIGAGIVALAMGLARRRFGLADLLIAFGGVVLSLAMALVVAVGLAAIAAYALGKPMSWFARPAPAIIAFGAAALAGMLAVQAGVGALLRHRGTTGSTRALALLGGVLLFWMIVLAALTLAGLGSAYVALWWAAGGAAGLLIAAFAREEHWWIGALIAGIPGGVLTLQLLLLLTRLFVPVFGRLPLLIAPDLVLATLVATVAGAAALALLPGAHHAGPLGRAALGASMLAIAALVVSLAQQPYTARRPERLAIMHAQDGSDGELLVTGMDYLTPRRTLASVPSMHPTSTGARGTEFGTMAGPTGLAAPRLELLSTSSDAERDVRTLVLRASAPGAFRLRLRIPGDRIAGWSIPAPLPARAVAGAPVIVDYVAPPDTGWRLFLRVRGTAPVPLELSAIRSHATPAADSLMRALPPWTDAYALAVNEGSWRF